MKKAKFKNLFYCIGKINKKSFIEKEFEISLKRAVTERVNRGFIKTYKPVIDDAPYRIFDRMREYNEWCEKHLQKWLGYGKAS